MTGGPKTIIDDLKAMGIRVMTTANNHTMDGGNEGMFMTNRLLDEARIAHAGSGKDLAEARRAQFGITPKGTIGVVGMLPGTARASEKDRLSEQRVRNIDCTRRTQRTSAGGLK